MNTKLTVGMIAIAGVMLALSSVVANHAWAANPSGADQGQGHTQTCSKGNSGGDRDGPCPGESGGKGSTETTNAGKSAQIKKQDCRNNEEPPC